MPDPPPANVTGDFSIEIKKSTDAAKERFRVDTKKPLRLPSREELCYLAMDVYRLALARKLEYTNKHGRAGATPNPDFPSAVTALKIASEIAGYGKTSGRASGAEHQDALSAEEALSKLRSKAAKELDEEEAGKSKQAKA